MLILLWLLPPVLVAVLAMAWAAWAGRSRPALQDRSEAARERAGQRFAEAILREHPGVAAGRSQVRRPRDRSTGVAVRGQRPS
ncbi:MAG: hypothetical protein ACTHJH_04710 [Marmoricola sp.]